MTSHTKEIIRTFWALSKSLADARHYPSVSWLDSFSDYQERASEWWAENVDSNWSGRRIQALALLAQADELERIVNLVGPEALSSAQRWVLESADLIKEAVLQQSALDAVDSYCSPHKQFKLLDIVLSFHDSGKELIDLGVPVEQLQQMPVVAQLKRLKSTYSSEELDKMETFASQMMQQVDSMRTQYLSVREKTV